MREISGEKPRRDWASPGPCSPPTRKGALLSDTLSEGGENIMLSWALTFLVVALIAGLLGFAGIAGAAAGIAKILFVVFLVLFLISLVLGRRTPPVA